MKNEIFIWKVVFKLVLVQIPFGMHHLNKKCHFNQCLKLKNHDIYHTVWSIQSFHTSVQSECHKNNNSPFPGSLNSGRLISWTIYRDHSCHGLDVPCYMTIIRFQSLRIFEKIWIPQKSFFWKSFWGSYLIKWAD